MLLAYRGLFKISLRWRLYLCERISINRVYGERWRRTWSREFWRIFWKHIQNRFHLSVSFKMDDVWIGENMIELGKIWLDKNMIVENYRCQKLIPIDCVTVLFENQNCWCKSLMWWCELLWCGCIEFALQLPSQFGSKEDILNYEWIVPFCCMCYIIIQWTNIRHVLYWAFDQAKTHKFG